jgi:hypothetical protein
VFEHFNADRAVKSAFHVWQSFGIVDVASNDAHVFESTLSASTFNELALSGAVGKGCDFAIWVMLGTPKSKGAPTTALNIR